MKNRIHFTIVGMTHFLHQQTENHLFPGRFPLEENSYLLLEKDPTNPFDSEAIFARSLLWGTVGFVSNNPFTRVRGTVSAGRLYGEIKKRAVGKIRFITDEYIICSLVGKKKSKKILKKFSADQKKWKLQHLQASEEHAIGTILIKIVPMESDLSGR